MKLSARAFILFPWIAVAALSVSAASAWGAGRTTILAPLTDAPGWRDMAFLAAIPAACRANGGAPSLIALNENGAIGPEIQDYAKRYRPDRVVVVGGSAATFGGRTAEGLKAGSAEEAAVALSKAFWKSSKVAVVCASDDYYSALLASSVAGLLKAPLLFCEPQGLSRPAKADLRRLGVQELVAVGSGDPKTEGRIVKLDGANEVMAWVRKRGISVRYLAAVNPLDRDRTVIKKLSLTGALLAAGRGGLVAPLRYAVEWKRGFEDAPFKGPLPQGVPPSAAPAKSGTMEVGNGHFPFVLTGATKEENLRLSVDTNGDGKYEGPFASGDTLEVGGKRWAVSLGTRTQFGKTDVHLTWPTAERLCQDLRGYYKALGSPPDNLCLVGFPDAIPQAIFGHGGIVEEQASDLPYAFANDGVFAAVGVGRVVAENASFGTLYASRVLTYRDLLNPAWDATACQARWENSYRPLFENVGFTASYQHTREDVPWATPPTDGKGGVRGPSFGQASPLASCALLAHADHSWWRELGSTFRWDAEVLMAPTVVESGGCGTACMDREPDDRSVVARLFRQGAVAFAGATREAPAEAEPIRQEFWNGVLAGETIGQAHKRALNSALLAVFDRKEGADGAYRYCVNIRMQFGDPGLAIAVPSKPRSAPARTVLTGDMVSVFAPAKWWPVKIMVPEDWKSWVGKDLFVLRGAGAYALSDWCAEGYDLERMLVTAEFTSRRRVSRIEQVQKPVAPLGWGGTWYEQVNSNGGFTYRFAVRMVDFDQIKGRVVNSVAKLDYRLTFE